MGYGAVEALVSPDLLARLPVITRSDAPDLALLSSWAKASAPLFVILATVTNLVIIVRGD